MLLSAPKAAPEAELKCYLPEAQASPQGSLGALLPQGSPGQARSGLGPSFPAFWVLSPPSSLAPCSKQDWKTLPRLPLILC